MTSSEDPEEQICKNCGAVLKGQYCYSCGQKHQLEKHSFWHMMVHFIGDFFHFDAQLFNTLKPLFSKPGLVPKDFVNGKRIKHLNPIKMYVFVSIVFFALVFYSTDNLFNPPKSTISDKETTDLEEKYLPSMPSIAAFDSLTREQSERNSLQKKVDTPAIESEELAKDNDEKSMQDTTGKHEKNKESDVAFSFKFDDYTLPKTIEEYRAQQDSLSEEEKHGWLKNLINERLIYFDNMAKEDGINVFLLLFKIFLKNLPKLLFVLLPFFALVLKLLYIRRNVYFVDHLVFMIYFYCFLFIIYSVSILIDMALGWNMVWIVFLWSSFYLYFAMRRFYEQVRWKTILKFLIFGSLSSMVATLGILVNFIVAALIA